MAKYDKTITKTASDGNLYESTSCGCPGKGPINVPHWLIVEALAEGADLDATALRLAGAKKAQRGRTGLRWRSATLTAARAMVAAEIIDQMPEGWHE